jgi:hypothetical protein
MRHRLTSMLARSKLYLVSVRGCLDEVHASYDSLFAQRFWRILEQTATVMGHYRSPFVGKSSPAHFFWKAYLLLAYLLLLPNTSRTLSSTG